MKYLNNFRNFSILENEDFEKTAQKILIDQFFKVLSQKNLKNVSQKDMIDIIVDINDYLTRSFTKLNKKTLDWLFTDSSESFREESLKLLKEIKASSNYRELYNYFNFNLKKFIDTYNSKTRNQIKLLQSWIV